MIWARCLIIYRHGLFGALNQFQLRTQRQLRSQEWSRPGMSRPSLVRVLVTRLLKSESLIFLATFLLKLPQFLPDGYRAIIFGERTRRENSFFKHDHVMNPGNLAGVSKIGHHDLFPIFLRHNKDNWKTWRNKYGIFGGGLGGLQNQICGSMTKSRKSGQFLSGVGD